MGVGVQVPGMEDFGDLKHVVAALGIDITELSNDLDKLEDRLRLLEQVPDED